MFSMMASPNSEHFRMVAPPISRWKSYVTRFWAMALETSRVDTAWGVVTSNYPAATTGTNTVYTNTSALLDQEYIRVETE